MKPKSYEMVAPKPYLSVHFDCGYRKFYGVMNEVDDMLSKMWEEVHHDKDFEPSEAFTVVRDDDGDPYELRMCSKNEENLGFINKILTHYEVEPVEVGVDVVLSPY